MRKICGLIALGLGLVACGSTGAGPATPLPVTAHSSSNSSTQSAQESVRTVLSPLGLNLHTDPSVSSARVGSASQGTTLTVKGHTNNNGGWYQVQGATTTGWITADPSLTAPGYFQSYASDSRGFAALYPQSWTFSEEPNDVIFRPQKGDETIVVTMAASAAALGTEPPSSYIRKATDTEVVCGATGDLNIYGFSGGGSPTPVVGTAALLANRQSITLRLDASHYMRIAFNYAGKPDTQFANFYNSVTFNFPECEATPSPTPT